MLLGQNGARTQNTFDAAYTDILGTPIGGGTMTVKDSTGTPVMLILDNSVLDMKKTNGYFQFYLPTAGKFFICGVNPPAGYAVPPGLNPCLTVNAQWNAGQVRGDPRSELFDDADALMTEGDRSARVGQVAIETMRVDTAHPCNRRAHHQPTRDGRAHFCLMTLERPPGAHEHHPTTVAHSDASRDQRTKYLPLASAIALARVLDAAAQIPEDHHGVERYTHDGGLLRSR